MNDKIRIYLDTCVYCRPFDDQSQNRILRETDAFIRVLELAEAEKVVIVGSDAIRLLRKSDRKIINNYEKGNGIPSSVSRNYLGVLDDRYGILYDPELSGALIT